LLTARLEDNPRIFLFQVIDFLKFRYLLTFRNQIIIINMRLGRVAKRLIERLKMALHPVAFFLPGGIKLIFLIDQLFFSNWKNSWRSIPTNMKKSD